MGTNKPFVIYLCLQATREGQASHAHVHEIIAGLRELGWPIELFEPGYANKTSRVSLLSRILAFAAVQARCLRRFRGAGALYVRFHPAALPTVLAARLFGLPVIQEVNGPYRDLWLAYPWLRPFARILRWLMRWQLKASSSLIAVTPQLASWLREEVGERHVAVVPNGANASTFHPGAIAKRSLPEQRVVFIGAMAKWHGIPQILEAAESDLWPEGVSLVLAGNGVESPRVQDAARRCPHIIHLGVVPYSDIPGLLAGSIASLVTITDTDGRSATGLAPIKLFEAMACGVPVIASNLPGQAEFVRSIGCGLITPTDDSAAIATAVAELACDKTLKDAMGHRGRVAIETEHSWRARAEDTSDVLCRFLQRAAA